MSGPDPRPGPVGVRGSDGAGREALWRRQRHWPAPEASRFVDAGGVRWHVQTIGTGPIRVLGLHGTGASTHSFAPLVHALGDEVSWCLPDLPGQGFSTSLRRTSLPAMASALAELLATLDVRPDVIVGHSAGVAVALRLVLDEGAAPGHLVGLAPAPVPLGGLSGVVFAPLARLLAGGDWAARLVASRARSPAAVARMVAGTGSTLPQAQLACYRTLLSSREHVAGTLAMMADWDLAGLAADLPRLSVPISVILGANDRTLPRDYRARLAAALPTARFEVLDGLGHLAHEEAPERIATALRPVLDARPGAAVDAARASGCGTVEWAAGDEERQQE